MINYTFIVNLLDLLSLLYIITKKLETEKIESNDLSKCGKQKRNKEKKNIQVYFSYGGFLSFYVEN